MKRLMVALAIAGFSVNVFAGPFRITNCPAGQTALCTSLETEVNKNLPDADASTYLKGMSNAQAISGKGTYADYATHYDLFVLGVAGGAGADVGGKSISDVIGGNVDSENLRGIGAQLNGYLGLNLGVLPFKKLERSRIYINTGAFDKTSGDVKAKISSYGIHYQHYLIKDKDFTGFRLFHWGGLVLTTGVEWSKFDLDYGKTLTQTATVSGQNATYTGPLSVKANIKSTSIPIELSTSIQYLYFLSTYLGAGMDFNSGSSTVNASSTGTITVAGTGANGAIDLGQSGKPDSTDFRYFVGQQINFPLVKIFAQLNQSLTNDTVGVAAGVKLAW